MNRFLTMSATMGMAAAVLWSAGAMAEVSLSDPKQAEGKVVDMDQSMNMATQLKLDNGVTLVMADSSKALGTSPKVGDEVMAHYVDNGADKLATFLRVLEVQAP